MHPSFPLKHRPFVAAHTEHIALLDAFLCLDGPAANLTVLNYRNDLAVRGKALGTVYRRLAAMRSFTKLGTSRLHNTPNCRVA